MGLFMNIIRKILGIFFLGTALLGCISIYVNFIDNGINGVSNHFEGYDSTIANDNPRNRNKYHENVHIGGASSSNAPIFYSSCLLTGCWLLFGEKKKS